MTAEIAVLNRNAIALAADSAVTLQLPEGPKIYHTNKLFTLSKYRPVGIMIYGGADFMGVPWETIIKQYRSHLGRHGFPRLEQYAASFLSFMEGNASFFPIAQQRIYCGNLARSWLRHLKMRLRKAVQEKLGSTGPVSEASVKSIFRGIVVGDIAHLRTRRKLPSFSRSSAASVLRRHRKEVDAAIESELQKLTSAVPLRLLRSGCVLAIMRDYIWYAQSGIVVAGFGDDEFFPALRCHTVDSVVDGKLRFLEDVRRRRQIAIGGVSASVIAFAQSEMVALFMNGIDRDYRDYIQAFLSELLAKAYPSSIEKAIGAALSQAQKARIVSSLRKIGAQLSAGLDSAFDEYSRTLHSDPIVDIVNLLPKEELAAMAEALVNLTSFKRHVTRQAETVGGPIDVAVISRGDGFVWIKRKHYFSAELNPHFLANYNQA
jgi:hypothetical protein